MMLTLLATVMTAQVIFPLHESDTDDGMEQGVLMRTFPLAHRTTKLRELDSDALPAEARVIEAIDLKGADFDPFADQFLSFFDGFIMIEDAGTYAFELTSDDGSQLWMEGTKVVDNDGEHPPESQEGSIRLTAGPRQFQVKFFESGGGQEVSLSWRPPGATEFTSVPPDRYRYLPTWSQETSGVPIRLMRPLERGRPGHGMALDGVHPAFTRTSVRPEGFDRRIGGIDWLPDGRMIVTTWDEEGGVYLLEGATSGDAARVTATRIAAGLAEPLGVKVIGNRIFVLQKQELTELIDADQDGIVDIYRCVCAGWPVSGNFHEFAFGLEEDEGDLIFNLAIAINPGGASTNPQMPMRGSVVRVDPDTGEFTVVAHGLRTPNGIGRGVDGELFVTDNQGDWLPASKILHVQDGDFFGSRAVLHDAVADVPIKQPVVWLPQGEIGNSPSQVIPLRDGPYAGQMAHGEVTHGGLKRVAAELVDGQYQGAVFRFTQGLEGGINRVSVGPDGAIYTGGVGSNGNWSHAGNAWFGLDRLAYNGAEVFEPLAIHAKSNGIEIEFTQPLAQGVGDDPDDYLIEQFWYKPTAAYGGPKLDEERLVPRSVTISNDRRSVFLELDGMKPQHVLYVRLFGPWKSEDGEPLWTSEAWYTMNVIPSDRSGAVGQEAVIVHNVLTDEERAAGWRLLFDGDTTEGWRGFQRPQISRGWQVQDGCLTRVGSGGDIITEDQFEDFELSLEWSVEPGGNSGIFYHVTEEGDWVWETGPEMQILDNELHPDGDSPYTSAGANYALHAPKYDHSKPAPMFNHAVIRVKDGRVQYFLNGEAAVDFVLMSDEWERKIAASKFASMPLHGRQGSGHIALQDHGDLVKFRNIKIRELD
jgi:cytochrome c